MSMSKYLTLKVDRGGILSGIQIIEIEDLTLHVYGVAREIKGEYGIQPDGLYAAAQNNSTLTIVYFLDVDVFESTVRRILRWKQDTPVELFFWLGETYIDYLTFIKSEDMFNIGTEVKGAKLRQAVLNTKKRFGKNRCAGMPIEVKIIQIIHEHMVNSKVRIIDCVKDGDGTLVDTRVRRVVTVPTSWLVGEGNVITL